MACATQSLPAPKVATTDLDLADGGIPCPRNRKRTPRRTRVLPHRRDPHNPTLFSNRHKRLFGLFRAAGLQREILFVRPFKLTLEMKEITSATGPVVPEESSSRGRKVCSAQRKTSASGR